ncbi:formin-J-like [Ruditapes philippinarum]|uniref:formin-J-like n=1 Tax=Ruditapes philippinarum TaxID=129788 RepID=UPI00295B7CBB|nr:formin-J-like [Ruditapes philippinarum]
MNLTTSSYSNMLGGMWGPEGSEINERLKRLEQLQQMRKEREAKLRNDFKSAETGVNIVRTERIKSSDIDSENPSGYRFRRTMSMRENETDRYGGARPKMGSFSLFGQDDNQETDGNPKTIFSGIVSSVLGTRKPLRADYSSRSRLGSGDSDSSDTTSTSSYRYDFSRPNVTENSYSSSYSRPEESKDRNIFSGITKKGMNRPGYESSSYSRRMNTEIPRVNDEQNSYDGDEYSNEQTSNENEDVNTEHFESHEIEDHDEEPKYFIERLKNGNGNSQSETNGYGHSIPAVPPYNGDDSEVETSEVYYEDLHNSCIQPEDDILSVAQEISTTFGNLKSPTYLTPKNSSQKSYSSKRFSDEKMNSNGGVEDPDVSVTYVLQEADYDSEGDEEGKTLPVRESMYIASTTEWNALDQTQGKLDEMHEFFTGEAPNEDPNISRELDGGKVKAELEKSFSTPKTSTKVNGNKTPTSVKKSAKKGSAVKRSKSPLDKLKSSESENDSVATSESENDVQKKRPTTPSKNGTPKSAKKAENKHGMSLTDKLAKLESLTQEKKRKHSFSETEGKKNIPSYMTATSSSQKKRAKERESSPRNLKKDVRELKQFVHEHASEPNTPVTSPTKHFSEEFTYKERKDTREMSVQTEFVIDFPDIVYVCKHCGKSSQEEAQSPLTKENLSKAYGQKAKRESPDSEKAKTVDNKISSKDSVKSFGETSTKSEKIYRYKPKATGGAQSYMKGTTSSRLRNNANNLSNSDGKARKGSAPELVHLAELESAKSTSSLKGIVSQKAKAIESSTKREKNKPTLSLFRGSSVERNKSDTANKKSQLAKSKSVDQVNVLRQELLTPSNDTKTEKQTTESKVIQNKTSPENNAPPNPVTSPTKKKAPTPPKVAPKPTVVEKLDLSSLDSPKSPISSRSPRAYKRPPLASPRVQDTEISPRSESSEVADDGRASVESKGQFTTLDDNPFIKNDSGRRNSLKGHDKNESVWEKAESRSRDSSLKRSNSTSDRERPSSASSLKRHNTSAGEKSSVSELTWSDSGSTGSLRGSKSSLHGSNSSLNKDSGSAFYRPRTVSQSSITSQTSQNAMLNLLSPIGTTRHPVSGAMETDVDAAYNDQSKDLQKTVDHDEETVNRAHLDFAKKACDTMLEFELKKRDSSNESDKGKNKTEDNKENNNINKENNNNIKNLNKEDTSGLHNGVAPAKKEKPKKGFRKLFKK